jgi:hypothetical protein
MELDKQTLEEAKTAVENAFPEIFTKENVIDILDSIEQDEKEEEEEEEDFSVSEKWKGGKGFEMNGHGVKGKITVKKAGKKGSVLDQLDYAEKEELKDELKEELKEEMRSEMKEELLDEMKGELVGKVKEAIGNLCMDDYINKKETTFSVDEHNKITLDNLSLDEKSMAKAIVEGIEFD